MLTIWTAGRNRSDRRRTPSPRLPADDDIASPPEAPAPPASLLPLTAKDRACCCPGLPTTQVLVSPAAPVDSALLLCRHHWRRHAPALLKRGAVAYDRDGEHVKDAAPPTPLPAPAEGRARR